MRTVGPSYEVKILVLYSTGVNSFIYTEIIDNFNLHMDVVHLGPLFSLPNLRLDFLLRKCLATLVLWQVLKKLQDKYHK